MVAELGASALFGARFRENAARSLLIPRAYPGRRTPLWQQRLKAQSLLEVARRYPQFPVILETYRECLRDVLDVPGLLDLLRKLHTRELSLVEVETRTASPFASSLLFDYVASYMYEGDTPAAERRAVALALDRDLLRELLGQEELRDLIDPGALEQVEDDLQHRSEHLRARDADALHEVLRRVGDLTTAEVSERWRRPARPRPGWSSSSPSAARSAPGSVTRSAGSPLRTPGCSATPSASSRPAACPTRSSRTCRTRCSRLLRRYARTHGPFETGRVRARYGVDAGPALAELERAGELVRGELRPLGTEREWCDPEVLRRLRRASLAVLRKEIEPVGQATLARFAPAWQGVDRYAPAGAGVDRLRDVLAPLQGLPLAPELWEKEVFPRRLGAYSPYWLDELCASGEVVWVGAGPLGGRAGRVALYFRDDAALLGPPPPAAERPNGELHELLRERLARGACFFSDLLVEYPAEGAEELREALWDLAWAGEATNDAFAPLRSRAAKPAGGAAGHTRRPPRRALPSPRARRASAAGPLVAGRGGVRRGAGRPRGAASRVGRAPSRAPRRAHARARARRGVPGRVLGPLPGAVRAGDDRRRPPRLLRRGPRRRPVRASRRRRAAPRAGGGAADSPVPRRRRPGAALRRRAALAGSGRQAAVAPAGRVPCDRGRQSGTLGARRRPLPARSRPS